MLIKGSDSALRRQMGDVGRARVAAKYERSVVLEIMVERIEALLKGTE